MEISLKYNDQVNKLAISKINSWDDLNKQIRDIFKISTEKEIEIYTQPENTFLTSGNFEEEFLNKKNKLKGLSISEELDLDSKIKNIGLFGSNVPINKIQDQNDSFDNAESIVIDKHQLFNGKCDLCKNVFHSCRFGCLLCPNYFLCSNCEENHPHPMIKYKSNILSDNINKIIVVNSTLNKKDKDLNERVKKKLGVKKINPITLRTNISSNSFTMGSNQERMINLLIKNNNKFLIPKNTLGIFIKNQFDLNIVIKDEMLFNDIQPGMEVPITLYFRSNEKSLFETYNLKIEVMNNSLDIIAKPIDLKIDIKNDDEDNELNKHFTEFPSIILLPKDKKKKLQYIIDEKLSIKSPQEINAIMEKFKWSIDQAIIDLTN